MRILVDIDDCIYPWYDLAHAACERAGVTNGIRPTSWECHTDYGITLDEWLEVMRVATLDGSLYTGDPMPGSAEALQTLRDAGHTLHIVTARGFFQHGDLIRRHTVEWLRDHQIPHDSLTFTKDKTFVQVDVAIDDSWKNVEALAATGVATWLMDAEHNQGVEYEWRVANITEFAEAVLRSAA